MRQGTLGVLAGGGPFPGQVADAAVSAGRKVFIIGFEGFADPAVIGGFPHRMVRLGAAGEMLRALRAHDCRDLVMVGPVRRPSLLTLRPDAEGMRLVGRIGRATLAGDDGLLAAVAAVLAEEGFSVVGAHEIIGEALGPAGLLAGPPPDSLAQADLARGVAVVRALGAVDVGQACVVQSGSVLAVEAIEGTDRMLARAGLLALAEPGGVLVKLVKPGQDRRADLPTIGPRTIEAAHAAGLRGVAFEAGGTLVADLPACVEAANRLGVFLLGLDADLLDGAAAPRMEGAAVPRMSGD